MGVPQGRPENRPPLRGRGSGEGQGRKARWVWAQRVLSAEWALHLPSPPNICAPPRGPPPRASPQGGSEGCLQGTGWGTPHPGVWSAEARAQTEAGGPGGQRLARRPSPQKWEQLS